jgi:2'-hydroxyisoflavone reductase
VLPDPRFDVGMRRTADLARTVGLTTTPLAVDLPAEREAAMQAAAEAGPN